MSPDLSSAPPLPNGLVAVVKRDCPTCELVAPVLHDLHERAGLTVITQDDPEFPIAAEWVRHDDDLALSWHHDIEAVPTLVRVVNGVEDQRTVGWSRHEWEQCTGVDGLGEGLPDWRPGCGSLSVDPAYADELAVRFSGSRLHSRRVELASLEDEWEAMFHRGWSDGLPVVPPTEARVLRMLEGTTRDRTEIVAVVPPSLIECTVEKVAVNAVMAGCAPEHLPVVIAALKAACTDDFNMHGVLATTMSVGPVLVVNGPVAKRIGMNHGLNALGQGNRANSTIGRALQLVVRNVGGGHPGGVDRATFGSPAKVGFCFAEDEAGSPWTSLAESRGWRANQSTVTVFAGESPRIFADERSRTPDSLTRHLAQALQATVSPRMMLGMDAMLVLSPEHMARYADAGWSRDRFMEELSAELLCDADELLAGFRGVAAGLPPAAAGQKVPKFRPGGLLVAHAGGAAGLFSAIVGGWANGPRGSDPVTREITP
ncbi:MAG: thioredoxin [Acidimicrobiia bacterium]|nr:thioredoxin [Acidimicrobiia bacterium]